jgi:pimeloyl-ACP methyl ester carboxylesterase
MEDFLLFRSSRIHYNHWGTGTRLLFGFHGYGESAASFTFLGEALEGAPGEAPAGDYTLIAIDLPFHGETEWKEGLFFDPLWLPAILTEIATRFPGRLADWWLLGYSMGGRIALQLLGDSPSNIQKMLLLAPDGLKVNLWYWIATRTRAGNALFRWTMRWPGWLFLMLRLGNTLHLVNPSIYKFTVHYIDDDRVRQDLYIRWTTMRGFRPRLSTLAEIIRSKQLPVTLIFGRYDRIISWERGEQFRKKGIAATCNLILLPAGHQLLKAQYLDVLLAGFTAEEEHD